LLCPSYAEVFGAAPTRNSGQLCLGVAQRIGTLPQPFGALPMQRCGARGFAGASPSFTFHRPCFGVLFPAEAGLGRPAPQRGPVEPGWRSATLCQCDS